MNLSPAGWDAPSRGTENYEVLDRGRAGEEALCLLLQSKRERERERGSESLRRREVYCERVVEERKKGTTRKRERERKDAEEHPI